MHLAFDKDKLMQVTRDFARDHRLSLPAGYEKSQKTEQVSLYERVKLNETGLSKEDHMEHVTEAWQLSDNPKAFVQALAERGYVLATGKRQYVLVDHYGGMHALPKLIGDKSVRAKDIRDFLGKDFPPEFLPSVEDAKRLIEAQPKPVENVAKTDTYADRLEELKHAYGERRHGLEQEREILNERQETLRESQSALHRAERQHLRAKHVAAIKAVRLSRYESRPTGLGGFLAKVTGLTLLRKKIHHHQDARALESYRKEQASLKTNQQEEEKALKFRMMVQTQAVERRARALEGIEKRELATFNRDHRRYLRDRARKEEGQCLLWRGLSGTITESKGMRPTCSVHLREQKKSGTHTPRTSLTPFGRQQVSVMRGGPETIPVAAAQIRIGQSTLAYGARQLDVAHVPTSWHYFLLQTAY